MSKYYRYFFHLKPSYIYCFTFPTGLDLTEFMFRLMAWLCTHKQTNHSGSNGNSQMCIVTGPNIDIANKLIKRLKGIFDTKLALSFNDKETVLRLNGFTVLHWYGNSTVLWAAFFKYYTLTNSKEPDAATLD